LLLALLLACGLATYYCHLYMETDEDGQDGADNSALLAPAPDHGFAGCPGAGHVKADGARTA
jgi:hypothetical protein